jgi:hypothetical protein
MQTNVSAALSEQAAHAEARKKAFEPRTSPQPNLEKEKE